LLATATSKSDLHATVNKCHIFQEVVKLYPPSKQVRKQVWDIFAVDFSLLRDSFEQILAQIVNERLHIAQDIKEDPEAPLNYAALALQTDGYTAVDLRDLVARAFHQAAIRLARSGQQVRFTHCPNPLLLTLFEPELPEC
jgi:peroxin-1